MELTHPLLHQEPDAAADLPALLRAAPAALAGWGLQAVLGWLISRWFGRVATQIEQMLQMFRAGRFGQAGELGVASRQAAVSNFGHAEATPCRFGWLEAGFGLEGPRRPISPASAKYAGSGLSTLRRAVAVERSTITRAPQHAMPLFDARTWHLTPGCGRVSSAYRILCQVRLVVFRKAGLCAA